MDKYLFIDDSGSKEWVTPHTDDFVNNPPERTEQNLNFWRGNYFVLAGVHVDSETLAKINSKINSIKIEYFGTKYVEIKSTWLRNPEKRKRNYLEKFNMTEKKLREFIDLEWYKILEDYKNSIKVQAVVLDKRYYKYREGKYPLELTVVALFDRVEKGDHKECSIVFDQMDDEIRSTQHTQGRVLRIHKKEVAIPSFQNKYSHKISFEKSCNSNMLQIADTVAYNVYRQFLDFGHEWDNSKIDTLPEYSHFEKISDLFYKSSTGQIKGYGLVKVPDPNGRRWKKG
jgi:hypothetical protein